MPLKPLQHLNLLHWYHWLILGLSLLLTFSAWFITNQQSQEKIQLIFEKKAEQATFLIQERMKKYEDALWAGVALLQVKHRQITRQDWRTYYENLNIDAKYPGINGIGVIFHIHPETLDEYVKHQTKENPSFKIHPQHNIADFWPITYIEPEEKNAAAIGLDIAHETNRYTAALKARDTGLAQITGPIVLVQDQSKTSGFLFYTPFYQDKQLEQLEQRQSKISGLVYAPFVVNKLMEGTLSQKNRYIGIRIMDNDEIIFDENQPNDPYYDAQTHLELNYQLEMYGRQWQLNIRPNLLAKEFTVNHQPMLILSAGILIDALLMSLFIILVRSNKKTQAYANELTKDLAKRNLELETEIEERKRLAITAENATKAKSRFLSNMSHEIRTPLNAILGFINICLKTPLTEKQSDYLGKAKLASGTLLSLINQTLDYSKIESGKLEIENIEFNLFELLDKINAIFSMQATDKNIDFIIEIPQSFPPFIIGDPLRLEQVLLNLCSNAFKFTNEGQIKISINFSALSNNKIKTEIIISDTGLGIKTDEIAHLFESFKQADSSTTRKFGGTGLGLTISKQLIELMGGEIKVTSEPNIGSQFTIDLQFDVSQNNQLSKPEPEPEPEPSSKDDREKKSTIATSNLSPNKSEIEQSFEKNQNQNQNDNQHINNEPANNNTPIKPLALQDMNILVVEDIALNQMVARVILEENGAQISIANNGVEALEILSSNQNFDLILMDIQMPVMDGYETTEKILANPELCHIPIIAMTANAVVSDVEQCLKAGMKSHIAKPLEEDDILIKIKNCLS